MSRKPHPLQSLYRLTVMVGVLVVASMAAYRYGPPPERLASMIDSAVARVEQMSERLGQSIPASTGSSGDRITIAAPASAPAPAWPSATPATTIAAPSPLAPAAAPPRVRVEPIGRAGSAYRATSSAPGPGGFVHRFNAIAETPEQAELAVLNKMSSTRRGG